MSLVLGLIASFILGTSKAGLKGLGIVVVALMAIAFPAKASTGILMPLLIICDVIAVTYYKRHVQWKYLIKFLPAMLVGVLIGALIGKDLDEQVFKKIMAGIILFSVVIMFWRDRMHNQKFPSGWWFAGTVGFGAGFTTMLGNLAGAFSNIFFLATRMPKNEIIGTAAWLFLIINLFKLPFHIFLWGTIQWQTFTTILPLIPAAILGFLIGLKIVKRIHDQAYRNFLMIVTAIGAVLIFLK